MRIIESLMTNNSVPLDFIYQNHDNFIPIVGTFNPHDYDTWVVSHVVLHVC